MIATIQGDPIVTGAGAWILLSVVWTLAIGSVAYLLWHEWRGRW